MPNKQSIEELLQYIHKYFKGEIPKTLKSHRIYKATTKTIMRYGSPEQVNELTTLEYDYYEQ